MSDEKPANKFPEPELSEEDKRKLAHALVSGLVDVGPRLPHQPAIIGPDDLE